MKHTVFETVLAVMLVGIAIILLNPVHAWMPDMMVSALLIGALVVFAIFAGFIVREKNTDERDAAHRALAGRNAYLSGLAVIILGIIIEGRNHAVDTWLVIALVAMLIAKISTRLWSDRTR